MDWTAAGSVLGLAMALGTLVGWLIPSPKDRQRQAEQRESERIGQLEKDHRDLERKYIESNAKLGAKVDQLANVCAELTAAVKDLTHRMNGGSRHG